MDDLGAVVRGQHAAIGVITTPAKVAQEVADRLVEAGVTSILNFAPSVLTVPPHVSLRKVDLSIELQILSFYQQRAGAIGTPTAGVTGTARRHGAIGTAGGAWPSRAAERRRCRSRARSTRSTWSSTGRRVPGRRGRRGRGPQGGRAAGLRGRRPGDRDPGRAPRSGPTGCPVEERPYRRGDVAGYRLVVAATDDPATNRAVFEDGEAAGVWVNSADDPASCSFTLPSVVRRGPIMVTVSTGGHSPALATWLRGHVEDELGPEYEILAGPSVRGPGSN